MQISLCKFKIHSFGKWEEPEEVKDPDKCGVSYIYQKRTCSVCNKVDVNVITTTKGHKFGKWENEELGSITCDGRTIGKATIQKRTCSKCGKIETDIQQATI